MANIDLQLDDEIQIQEEIQIEPELYYNTNRSRTISVYSDNRTILVEQ